MPTLTPQDIQRKMKDVPGWTLVDRRAIRKQFTFGSFPEAVSFVVRIAFSADSKGKDCIEGVYRRRIESGIGSQIGNDGMYTAGMNTTGGEVTDTLTAEDTANLIESLRYVTVRYEKITAVTPAARSRSYWIPIPHLLIIQGEGTHFSNQDTLVSFDPPSSVHLSWEVVLDDTAIWCFVVVMPAWYAGENMQA